MPHLSEETLHEYLDDALAPAIRADVDAHLATCADCTAELAELRGLFAAIESLPLVALERDLMPAVLTQIGVAKVGVPGVVRWALAVQVLAVAVSVGLIAALVDFSALKLPTVSLTWPTLPSLPDFSRIFSFASFSLHLDPPVLLLALTLICASLLWLVGNGLLLLPRNAALKRRLL